MGLDTSHDCWHGPYSAFHRWRSELHHLIQVDRGDRDDLGFDGYRHLMEGTHPRWKWPAPYDSGDPLDVLMTHSDCDGEIPHVACAPLADALQGIIDRQMPARALYDQMRPSTERFIAGLRRAHEAGEAVTFG